MLLALGTAQRQAGDTAHRETLLEAARLAETNGNADALVRAALANTRGWWSATGEVDAERVAVLEAAVGVVDPSDASARAKLLANLAVELTFAGEFERRQALSDEAVLLARRASDPDTLLQVLLGRHDALWVPETFADRQAAAREAMEIAGTIADPFLEFRAVDIEATASLERGDIESFRRCQAIEERLAADLGHATFAWQARYFRAVGVLLSGDAEEAERITTEALDLGLESGQPEALEIYGAQLVEVRRTQGRLDEMVGLFAQLMEDDPNIAAVRSGLVNVYCVLGRDDDALALVADGEIEAFAAGARDSVWTAGMAMYAEAARTFTSSIRPRCCTTRWCRSVSRWPSPGSASTGRSRTTSDSSPSHSTTMTPPRGTSRRR